MSHRVLVVDDEIEMAKMLAAALKHAGFDSERAGSLDDAWQALRSDDFDVVLADVNLGDGSGLTLAAKLAEQEREIPVVALTAFGSLENAVEAIRAGAYDFLTKPVDMDQVVLTVTRAAQHRALSAEVRRLRRAAKPSASCGDLIGEAAAMQSLYDMIRRLAKNPVPVLIVGESGTGKELIARALHDLGPRAGKPFVAVNCAAMPDSLLESELFGHRRGAFTGASDTHDGLFVQADGGTLFLDEIGEMGANVQAKLLRALQERTVRPVGADREVSFDARILTATNRDLESEIKSGSFREDLYYRINVVRLDAPPLRARAGDIPLLAQHFVEKYAARYGNDVDGLSRGAVARLIAHDWPGNVRELENAIARAVALAQFSRIRVLDLAPELADSTVKGSVFDVEDPALLPTVADFEERYIHHVLKVVDGNKTSAADVLGMDRKTLYRKLERYAEDAEDARAP